MFRSAMTLDGRNRNMTAIVGGAVLVAIAVTLVTRPLVGLAVLAVLALVWAMSPTALVVDGGELRIERRAWRPLRIPIASIRGASPLFALGGGTLRLFGVGGFFGSYGLFHNGRLGRFRLYATHAGEAVVVQRVDGALPLVLTPDDVAGTLGAINRRPRLAE
jgi:Bacterial PH domain